MSWSEQTWRNAAWHLPQPMAIIFTPAILSGFGQWISDSVPSSSLDTLSYVLWMNGGPKPYLRTFHLFNQSWFFADLLFPRRVTLACPGAQPPESAKTASIAAFRSVCVAVLQIFCCNASMPAVLPCCGMLRFHRRACTGWSAC